MRAYQQTRAFFLHREEALASGNTPVLLLTEQFGMRRVLVKGLTTGKSVLVSRLDPLLLLDTQLYAMDRACLLTGATVLHRYADHHLPYATIEALWSVLGLLRSLMPEEVPHPEVFARMGLFLSLLPTALHPEVLALMMQVQLLTELGHMHVNMDCMHCSTPLPREAAVYLRPEDMLLLCARCKEKLPTAVDLTSLPALAYKTLVICSIKSLDMGAMLQVPPEVRLVLVGLLERRRQALS